MNTNRLNNLGFTLIEILIALAVFAILATITTSTLYRTFQIKKRVDIKLDHLNQLEQALIICQRDIKQFINRPIKDNETSEIPAFIGKTNYIEFTRGGMINPFQTQQSSLQRIALLCENKQLIRQSWTSLDARDRKNYNKKILLTHLTDCDFSFLDSRRIFLPTWKVDAQELFPHAIQVRLNSSQLGKIQTIFVLPQAFYAQS